MHQKHSFFLFVWNDSDIARQKNETEPKDVVKNWMRQKNTLDYLGLWEKLHNSNFKGIEFDPLLVEAGSNAFTMSPTKWVELIAAIGILTKNGAGGGTYAQSHIRHPLRGSVIGCVLSRGSVLRTSPPACVLSCLRHF